MNQKKVGCFFKELRKEKGLTQEQLADQLNVTGRTISRWETAINMPDLDVLIEMADFYKVDIRELIDGERNSEETVFKAAEYRNNGKNRLMEKIHFYSWIGVLSFIVFIVLNYMELSETGITEEITLFCSGVSFAVLIIIAVYTSRYIGMINAFKLRIYFVLFWCSFHSANYYCCLNKSL